MNKKHLKIFIFVFSAVLFFCYFLATAETIDQFDLKKKFTINGGLNLNSTYANSLKSSSTSNKTQPFFFGANANLTLQLWGYDAPFSFSYTTKKMAITNPYNKFTLQPQYKWVKFYVGTSNMSFSKWSYQGINFNGFGVELTPEKIKIALFAGKFQQQTSQTLTVNTKPDRIAMGIKLGSKYKKTTWQAIWFYAYDKGGAVDPTTGIAPTYMSNIVGDVILKTAWKKYNIDINWATSALRQSLSSGTSSSDSASYGMNDYKIHHAFNIGLSRKIRSANVALRYERVAPNYITLGTTFSGNDLERYFTQFGLPCFKGKLNTSGSLGIERNNLTGLKNNTNTKWVGNMALAYQFSPKLNFQLSGSNLLNTQQVKRSVKSASGAGLETMNETRQMAQNASLGMQYTQDGDAPKNMSLNITYQRTDSKISGSEEQTPDWSDNYGLTCSFSHPLTKYKMDVNYNASIMKAVTPNVKNDQLNVGVSISKKTKIDLVHNMALTYSYANQQDTQSGALALSYSTSYQFKSVGKTPMGTLNFAITMNSLFEGMLSSLQQQDLNFMLGYQYQFGTDKKKGKT